MKTIIDKENGRKWEIIKHGENDYSVNYFEYFASCGWRQINPHDDRATHYTKESIEYDFDINIA